MAFSYVWSRIHFLSCPFFARMLFLLQYFSAFVNLWFPHSLLTRFPTSLILSSLCWYFDFTQFSLAHVCCLNKASPFFSFRDSTVCLPQKSFRFPLCSPPHLLPFHAHCFVVPLTLWLSPNPTFAPFQLPWSVFPVLSASSRMLCVIFYKITKS